MSACFMTMPIEQTGGSDRKTRRETKGKSWEGGAGVVCTAE